MKVRNAVLILSLASALASCHAPNAPQPLSPTLTLLFPDSTHVFDTVLFRGHYSDPIRSSWRFQWLFGDSTSTVSADSTITHVYDSAGTYNVQVTLVDSTGKTIAKQSGKISVLPLNGPTLTLSVPDTVYWGDSCVMRVSSSPFKSSWKYYWSFGDTTTFSSTQDSAVHWYLNPGTYTVLVDLVDTVSHIPLGSRIEKVRVVARHFDLTSLASMRFVEFKVSAKMSDTGSSGSLPCDGPTGILFDSIYSSQDSIQWDGSDFKWNSGSSYSDSNGATSSSSSIVISLDATNTTLVYDDVELFSISRQSGVPGSPYCQQQSRSEVIIPVLIFKKQSDTDAVFEYKGIPPNASITNHTTSGGNLVPAWYTDHAVWSASSFVMVRLFK